MLKIKMGKVAGPGGVPTEANRISVLKSVLARIIDNNMMNGDRMPESCRRVF